MSNPLESLKEYLTPELLGEAAKMYGENEIGIFKATSSLGLRSSPDCLKKVATRTP